MDSLQLFYDLYDQTIKDTKILSDLLNNKLASYFNLKLKRILKLLQNYQIHLLDNEADINWELHKLENELKKIENDVNHIVRNDYLKELAIIVPMVISLSYVMGYKHASDKALSKYGLHFTNTLTHKDYDKTLKMIKNKAKLIEVIKSESHLKKIQLLQDNTFGHILGANFKMGKSAKEEVRKAIKEEMIKGLQDGKPEHEIIKNAVERIQEKGIKSIDGSGGTMEVEPYTKMVVRSEMVRAQVTATEEQSIENGIHYVRISSHARPCPKCSPWQGVVCFIGSNPADNVRDAPTIGDARSGGLHHPNCKHTEAPEA